MSEILDTELIGEGVLSTMAHAHAELAASGGVEVIPRSATVRAVLVQSDLLRSWHDVDAATVGGFSLGAAAASRTAGRMVDVHADALEGHVTLLCEPFDAYEFDFSTTPSLEGRVVHDVTMTREGAVDAVLMWWDAHLDSERCLSTAPQWLDGRPGRSWRDHWRQAVYVLPAGATVVESAGDVVRVACEHDEYTLWFNAGRIIIDNHGGAAGEDTRTTTGAVLITTLGEATAAQLDASVAPVGNASGASGVSRAAPPQVVLEHPLGRPALDFPWNIWNANRLWMINDLSRRAVMEARARTACDALARDECVLTLGDTSYLAVGAAPVLASRSGGNGEDDALRVYAMSILCTIAPSNHPTQSQNAYVQTYPS